MGTERPGDTMRIATICMACSTITGLIITSALSYGGDREKVANNEDRSKKNEASVVQLLIKSSKTDEKLENVDKRLGSIEKKLEKLLEQNGKGENGS